MAFDAEVQDLYCIAGTGERVSFHHVDLVGATGATIGTLRFGFRVLKPILMAIAEYKKQSRAAKTPLACEVGRLKPCPCPTFLNIPMLYSAEFILGCSD